MAPTLAGVVALLAAAPLVPLVASQNPGCPCQAKPEHFHKYDCSSDDHPWATWLDDSHKCVTAHVEGRDVAYPADYGDSCKAHEEPGQTGCYDQSTQPWEPKPDESQADWCRDSWCFVDVCNCDSEVTMSGYFFPPFLYYSYATCGPADEYTRAVTAEHRRQCDHDDDDHHHGHPSCPCQAKPEHIHKYDCSSDDHPWATWMGGSHKCVTAHVEGRDVAYPADYGDSCKAHEEPAWASCYDQSATPWEPKPVETRADWCNNWWCFVDVCNCDSEVSALSGYFDAGLYYSYITCGSADDYTTASNAEQRPECDHQDHDDDHHDDDDDDEGAGMLPWMFAASAAGVAVLLEMARGSTSAP